MDCPSVRVQNPDSGVHSPSQVATAGSRLVFQFRGVENEGHGEWEGCDGSGSAGSGR